MEALWVEEVDEGISADRSSVDEVELTELDEIDELDEFAPSTMIAVCVGKKEVLDEDVVGRTRTGAGVVEVAGKELVVMVEPGRTSNGEMVEVCI